MRSPVYQIFVLIAALLGTREVAISADKDVSFLMSQPGGKALIWNLAGGKLGIPQPYTVVPAGSPNGDLQIGFSHSGYTVKDQSKHAELLIVVTVVSSELSEAEKQSLSSQGIELLSSSAPHANNFSLDVSLESDKAEEARLRSDLSLPQMFNIGTSQLLNIRWSDVNGKTLYDWLTSAAGLRLTVTARGASRLHSQGAWAIDSAKLGTWWSSHVGTSSDRLVTADGSGILAFELFSSGALVPVMVGSQLNRQASQIGAIKALAMQLMAIATPVSNGRYAISFDALAKMAVPPAEFEDISSPVTILAGMRPGELLAGHPEYVVDNSGSVAGLQALLRDQ